jgi:hypothetical protein
MISLLSQGISVQPLAPNGPGGSLFIGGMWGLFTVMSVEKIQKAWSGKPCREPEIVSRKYSSLSFLAGNVTNSINWFMERRGYRLIYAGVPALGILANVVFIPFYVASSYTSGRQLMKAGQVDQMIETIAHPSEKPFGSARLRAKVNLVANLSFMSYAIFSTVAATTAGAVSTGLATTFLVIFTACGFFSLMDFIYNFSKMNEVNQLEGRLVEVLS